MDPSELQPVQSTRRPPHWVPGTVGCRWTNAYFASLPKRPRNQSAGPAAQQAAPAQQAVPVQQAVPAQQAAPAVQAALAAQQAAPAQHTDAAEADDAGGVPKPSIGNSLQCYKRAQCIDTGRAHVCIGVVRFEAHRVVLGELAGKDSSLLPKDDWNQYHHWHKQLKVVCYGQLCSDSGQSNATEGLRFHDKCVGWGEGFKGHGGATKLNNAPPDWKHGLVRVHSLRQQACHLCPWCHLVCQGSLDNEMRTIPGSQEQQKQALKRTKECEKQQRRRVSQKLGNTVRASFKGAEQANEGIAKAVADLTTKISTAIKETSNLIRTLSNQSSQVHQSSQEVQPAHEAHLHSLTAKVQGQLAEKQAGYQEYVNGLRSALQQALHVSEGDPSQHANNARVITYQDLVIPTGPDISKWAPPHPPDRVAADLSRDFADQNEYQDEDSQDIAGCGLQPLLPGPAAPPAIPLTSMGNTQQLAATQYRPPALATQQPAAQHSAAAGAPLTQPSLIEMLQLAGLGMPAALHQGLLQQLLQQMISNTNSVRTPAAVPQPPPAIPLASIGNQQAPAAASALAVFQPHAGNNLAQAPAATTARPSPAAHDATPLRL